MLTHSLPGSRAFSPPACAAQGPREPELGSAAGDKSSAMILDKGTRTPSCSAASEALLEENDNCLFIHFNSIMKR